MKLKIVSLVAAIMMFACQAVSAEPLFLTLTGTTASDAVGATVLVLNKGADTENLSMSDVIYLNQTDIAADGSFALSIPFFIEDNYEIKSNALDFNLGEYTKAKTIYVSASGNDANSGLKANAPLKTLAKAYESIVDLKEIIISGAVTYTDVPKEYDGELKITGADSSAVLNVPSEISLKGDLTLNSLAISGATTFYANGKHLVIGDTVTSTSALTAYGAKKSEAFSGNTNIEIYGGRWSRIYGGGQAAVNGNTNLTVGGKVNEGCLINDKDTSTFSYCNIFGGGNNAAVSGKTNLHLTGNAVAAYAIGAGIGASGTAAETNILIDQNAKCMNVYGGSYDSALTCTTNVTLKDNCLVEAVFGGSQNAPLTGHTNVNLLGGDVSRRVYTGCYNNATRGSGLSFTLTWSTEHQVTGTTTLRIAPEAKVNSKKDLHDDNANNIGVYPGSRVSSSNRSSNEKNTVIFQDNCYSTFSGQIGTQDSLSKLLDLKYGSYLTVNASTNGDVFGTGTHGVIKLQPDKDHYGKIGSTIYYIPTKVTTTGDTTVTFYKDFSVNLNSANATTDGATANVDVTAKNESGEVSPQLIVALYDETNTLIGCDMVDATSSLTSKTVNFKCRLEAGKTYTVKATIWADDVKPLTTVSKLSFVK